MVGGLIHRSVHPLGRYIERRDPAALGAGSHRRQGQVVDTLRLAVAAVRQAAGCRGGACPREVLPHHGEGHLVPGRRVRAAGEGGGGGGGGGGVEERVRVLQALREVVSAEGYHHRGLSAILVGALPGEAVVGRAVAGVSAEGRRRYCRRVEGGWRGPVRVSVWVGVWGVGVEAVLVQSHASSRSSSCGKVKRMGYWRDGWVEWLGWR